MPQLRLAVLSALLFALPAASVASAATLKAATTTAATPLFTKMFGEYNKKTGTLVNFTPGTSPASQQALLSRTVDFAAAIISLDTVDDKDDSDVVQIPVALSAVVVAYNVPGLAERLNFNGRVLSDIYTGRIKKWNDPRLQVLNPRVRLPDLAVTPIYRSDPSGYSAIFTDYLSQVSKDWQRRVKDGVVVEWPAGIAAKNEDASVEALKNLPGAVVYAGLSRALTTRLTFGNVQNAAGVFVRPTEDSIEAAGQKAGANTDGVTYAKVSSAYPISNYIYVLLQRDQAYSGRTEEQARGVRDLVGWMLDEGQQYHSSLYFGQLTPEVAALARKKLASLTFAGKTFK